MEFYHNYYLLIVCSYDCCRWLKSFYSTDGLRVLQFDSEDLVKNIKESITEGTTVIIEVQLKIIFIAIRH